MIKLPQGQDTRFGDVDGRGLVIGGKTDQMAVRDLFD